MKSRDYDAPVKIIQILPIDNNSSQQPLKPHDFSFFKKLAHACRQATRWVTKPGHHVMNTIRPPNERPDHVDTPIITHTVHAPLCPSPTEPHACEAGGDSASSTGRASAIVVSDLAVLSAVDPDPTDARHAALAPQPHPTDARQQLEIATAAIVSQWLREKEQIAAIKAATLVRLRSWRQSLVTVRVGRLRQGSVMTYLLNGTVNRMRKTTRRNKRKVDHEVTHDLEVTKSTLLAQQHALENVTVQLNAVQKELARHKTMLAGLMAQVEAIDLKIVQSIQAPSPKKPKVTTETGHSRRPAAKKTNLSVERSREQRA